MMPTDIYHCTLLFYSQLSILTGILLFGLAICFSDLQLFFDLQLTFQTDNSIFLVATHFSYSLLTFWTCNFLYSIATHFLSSASG